jgi:hypothetical protein
MILSNGSFGYFSYSLLAEIKNPATMEPALSEKNERDRGIVIN